MLVKGAPDVESGTEMAELRAGLELTKDTHISPSQVSYLTLMCELSWDVDCERLGKNWLLCTQLCIHSILELMV